MALPVGRRLLRYFGGERISKFESGGVWVLPTADVRGDARQLSGPSTFAHRGRLKLRGTGERIVAIFGIGSFGF